jgi:hypothetical protein
MAMLINTNMVETTTTQDMSIPAMITVDTITVGMIMVNTITMARDSCP